MKETNKGDFYNLPLAKPEMPITERADLELPTEVPESKGGFYKTIISEVFRLKQAMEGINQLKEGAETKMPNFDVALQFYSRLQERIDDKEFEKMPLKFRNQLLAFLKEAWLYIEKSIDFHSGKNEKK